MAKSASEFIDLIAPENPQWIELLKKERWKEKRILSNGREFEFTKQEFLNALNGRPMTKPSKTLVPPYPHSGVDHPLFLTVDGQTVFHKIILFLKKNGNWDDTYLEMIAAAAATYQNYCIAQKQVNEYGPTTETGAGGLKKNPAIDIASASFRDFMTFSNKFGLNPLFEGKVKKNEDDDSEI